MKQLLLAFGLLATVMFVSCNDSIINGNDVNVDSTSSPTIYTYKSNGAKVTGHVEFYAIDSITSKTYKEKVRDVVNGLKTNVAYNYAPNGQVIGEFPQKDGKINGVAKLYFEDGKLKFEYKFINDTVTGIAKEYGADGRQIFEVVFSNGKVAKTYSFDNQGNKIIPVTDCLILDKIETGFYEYVNYNNRELLYQPIVKMKWSNSCGEPITERIIVKGTFISENEEWCTETNYFQGSSDAPLQPKISRQCSLQGSTGFKSSLGINQKEVFCNLYINDEFFKKVKISPSLVTSNRIQ